MFQRRLTSNMKAKIYPLIVQRDGDVCFYCKIQFTPEIETLKRTFDHLNNDWDDNRVENLVLAHLQCNNEKRNNLEMQMIALDKLKENLSSVPYSETLRERENNQTADELTEGELNRIINKITDTYLKERLPDSDADTFIPFTDTMNSIAYLVQQDTKGRGGQVAVRRAIDVRCCSIAEFQIIREDGKRIIRRRKSSS